MKKMLIIQDMCGFGRCSLTVALPVVSACKIQACPVPTSIFSNHTGFSTHFEHNLSEDISPYLAALDQLEINFDGVYCGFLGSVKEMNSIVNWMNRLSNRPFILIDPVMGDHGKIYKTVPHDYCSHMKEFIKHAKVITPNITECCLLTDTPYKDGAWSEKSLHDMAAKLSLLGPEQIVITGIRDDSWYYNYLYEKKAEDTYASTNLIRNSIAGASRPGVGDLFASITGSLMLKDYPFYQSVQIASDFAVKCAKESEIYKLPIKEGVLFESFLGELTQL